MRASTTADVRAHVSAMVKANTRLLLAYFLRRVDDREDAADLLSETFAVVWRRSERMPKDPDEARMWMYGVAAKVLANARRTRHRRDNLASALREELACAPSAEPDAGIQLRADVDRALSMLKDVDRELLRLVHWDGLTLAEAGTVLGLKASTARTRAERARTRLAALLGPEYAGAQPALGPRTPVTVRAAAP